MLQAEFFGLPGLADKASAGLEAADPSLGQGEAGGPGHAAPPGCQYDSVYLETGFHPVKSEFDALQQQQAATMEVTAMALILCFVGKKHGNQQQNNPLGGPGEGGGCVSACAEISCQLAG